MHPLGADVGGRRLGRRFAGRLTRMFTRRLARMLTRTVHTDLR